MNMRLLSRSFIILFLLVMTHASGQSIPGLINYQGRLTDQNGNPLPPGVYGIQFRIWDSAGATNGAVDLIWGQQQNAAIQTNGLFDVILGSPSGMSIPGATTVVSNLASSFTGLNCFLGIKIVTSNGVPISSPNEISPRQQFLSVPYAINGNPPGTIVAFGGPNIPPGWLPCDGTTQSREQFPDLFAAIGTAWGSGDGANTFNLPDLRGTFLRGVDAQAGRDPDDGSRGPSNPGGNTNNAVGSIELDQFRSHTHTINDPGHSHPMNNLSYVQSVSSGCCVNALTFPGYGGALPGNLTSEIATTGITINSSGGKETRPINVYVNYIIRIFREFCGYPSGGI